VSCHNPLVNSPTFGTIVPHYEIPAGGALAAAVKDAEAEKSVPIEGRSVPVHDDARARGLGGGTAVATWLLGIAARLCAVDWDACDRKTGHRSNLHIAGGKGPDLCGLLMKGAFPLVLAAQCWMFVEIKQTHTDLGPMQFARRVRGDYAWAVAKMADQLDVPNDPPDCWPSLLLCTVALVLVVETSAGGQVNRISAVLLPLQQLAEAYRTAAATWFNEAYDVESSRAVWHRSEEMQKVGALWSCGRILDEHVFEYVDEDVWDEFCEGDPPKPLKPAQAVLPAAGQGSISLQTAARAASNSRQQPPNSRQQLPQPPATAARAANSRQAPFVPALCFCTHLGNAFARSVFLAQWHMDFLHLLASFLPVL